MKNSKIKRFETKKINRLGTGYVVFVSKEAKELGWNNQTKITVAVIENGEGDAILIRKKIF